MVTTPEPVKHDDEPSAAEQTVRLLIAGHPQGAVRRIVLYLVAMVAMIAWTFLPGTLTVLVTFTGMIALGLLMMTDALA